MPMRRNIWDEMRRMHDDMAKMFDSMDFGPFKNRGLLPGKQDVIESDYRCPLSDVWETDDKIKAQIEVPGVNKDDIKVNATDEGVEVKVEKKDKKKDESKGNYRYERSYTGFYRYFAMPEYADTENIEASYKDGVLELEIPKKQVEEQKRKQIEVK